MGFQDFLLITTTTLSLPVIHFRTGWLRFQSWIITLISSKMYSVTFMHHMQLSWLNFFIKLAPCSGLSSSRESEQWFATVSDKNCCRRQNRTKPLLAFCLYTSAKCTIWGEGSYPHFTLVCKIKCYNKRWRSIIGFLWLQPYYLQLQLQLFNRRRRGL